VLDSRIDQKVVGHLVGLVDAQKCRTSYICQSMPTDYQSRYQQKDWGWVQSGGRGLPCEALPLLQIPKEQVLWWPMAA